MLYLTIVGLAFVSWLVLVALFTPHIPYHIEKAIEVESDHFVHVLQSVCHTRLEPDNRIDILTNGPVFYPAMLDAIRSAQQTVNMECYILKKGQAADRFVETLIARARAG